MILELGVKGPKEVTIGRFVAGLNDKIRDKLLVHQAATYDDAYKRACPYEAQFKGNNKAYKFGEIQENLYKKFSDASNLKRERKDVKAA